MKTNINEFELNDIMLANSVIKSMIGDTQFSKIHNALVQVRNALSVYYIDKVEEEQTK